MGGKLEFDREADVVRLNGASDLLLAMLLKAKFGEKFDTDALFSSELASLLGSLAKESRVFGNQELEFSPADLFEIQTSVYHESHRIGWWTMSFEARAGFVRTIALPWIISSSQVEQIIAGVDELRQTHAEIIEASKTD